MRARISDIAAAAGVSTTTVSRYLNGSYNYMSAETRKRIEHIIEDCNYTPSYAARALKTRRSRTVGIILQTFRYQVAAQTLTGISEVCIQNGYRTVICNTEDDPEREREALQTCLNQEVEGIILVPTLNDSAYYRQIAESRDIPIVLCTRRIPDWPGSAVYVRHDEMIREMLKHLYDQGFEKVQFFTDVPNFHKKWMADVFADTAQKYFNMSPSESVVFLGREALQFGASLDSFWGQYPDERKAVMAVNTHMLFLLLKELSSRHVKIPEELGVCGYDAVGWSELVPPGISAMRQPMKLLGRTAAEELFRCLQNSSKGEKKISLSGLNFYRASTILK